MKTKKTTSIIRGRIEIRNIIVVDCISSGTNYIEDIINRGYKPVVLELQPGGADSEEYNKKMQSNMIKSNMILI